MKVKRFVASVGATFDQFISKMENHDAVAKCVIDDVRQSAAKVRGEVNRVEHRCSALQKEQQKLEDEKALWLRRAKQSVGNQKQSVAQAGADEKALDCIRQSKILEKRIVTITRQVKQSEDLKESLRKNLTDIEFRLEDLESRRAVLASREVRANLMKNSACDRSARDSEDLFDRWEQDVLSNEYCEQTTSVNISDGVVDSQLAREFETEEEEVSLQDALDELKREMEEGDQRG